MGASNEIFNDYRSVTHAALLVEQFAGRYSRAICTRNGIGVIGLLRLTRVVSLSLRNDPKWQKVAANTTWICRYTIQAMPASTVRQILMPRSISLRSRKLTPWRRKVSLRQAEWGRTPMWRLKMPEKL